MLYMASHPDETVFNLMSHLYLFLDCLPRSSVSRTTPSSSRMSKAVQLLKTTQLSIKDISSAVGYPNQLHFSRAFKKVYGVPPSQWRKEK